MFSLEGSPSAPQILNQTEHPSGRKQPHRGAWPGPDAPQFKGAEFSCVGISAAQQAMDPLAGIPTPCMLLKPSVTVPRSRHCPPKLSLSLKAITVPQSCHCPPESSLSPRVTTVPRSWGAEYWGSLEKASLNYLGPNALFLGGGKLNGRSLGLWTPTCTFLFTRNP